MSPVTIPRIKLVNFHEYQTGIMAVRRAVFVDELGIAPDLEWDNRDNEAYYAVALMDNEIVGTGRMQADGEIGRIAILPQWRRQGLGSQILHCLIEAAVHAGQNSVYLSSQLNAVNFYVKLGFVMSGETYLAAGIPHQHMDLALTSNAEQASN